jgi:cytochrome c
MTPDKRLHFAAFVALLALAAGAARGEGDATRGAAAFQACAACHSMEPGRHLTGPTLADLFGRKAGTAEKFLRYSDALKRSRVTWNEQTLDAWLKDPVHFIPGNEMAFAGIKDDAARRDLIAYLKAADSAPGAQRAGPRLPDLKRAGADSVVKAIRHCGDTYFVTTGDGKIHKIWEFNLRLKTDTTDSGPSAAKPVLLRVGMQGDRAAVVFASPAELGAFIREHCE